ncbi:MAG: exo-alpha-sialidase [Acidimicrobiales bacterium]
MEQERSSFRARMTDHLPIAVGTTHGLFFVSDGIADGPFFKGSRVPAFLQVGVRYYAATVDPGGRSALQTSDDDGQSWSTQGTSVTFPDDIGATVAQICQIQPDHASPPSAGRSALLVGVEPAALFRSSDGTNFELLRGLWNHPDRPVWQAEAGGGLDTVLTHQDRPGRIIVAIAAGGVYRSDDDGQTWLARNGGIAVRPADVWSGPRRRVHKLALDAASPDSLFAQTNTGTYHSDNAGDSWTRVGRVEEEDGLASDFGFPVVAHPVEPGTAFVFPLESESYPCSPEGRPRVYRTTDGGAHWGMLDDGLPRENAHVTVLPDAFTIGQSSPYPLVFGTKAGQLFASLDHGDSWRLFAWGLPPVLCLRLLE